MDAVIKLYDDGYGWVRLGRYGPGIHWKPLDADMLFSERHGYKRSFVFGPWRFKYLPPVRVYR